MQNIYHVSGSDRDKGYVLVPVKMMINFINCYLMKYTYCRWTVVYQQEYCSCLAYILELSTPLVCPSSFSGES
jgi:hypothetical protein